MSSIDRKSKRVKFVIPKGKRFTSPGSNILFTPGEFDIPVEEAFELGLQGKGSFVDKKLQKKLDEKLSRFGLEDTTLDELTDLGKSMNSGNPESKDNGKPKADDGKAISGNPEGSKSDIPEDFPMRSLLIENGTLTLKEISEMSKEELENIKGIGSAMSTKIAVQAAELLSV